MTTLGKLPLFIVIMLTCGCPKQRPPADPPPKAPEAQDDDGKSELEAACFDGDPEACDALGH
jgi:hypothetical protein